MGDIRKGEDTPITWGTIRAWIPPIVTGIGLLVTGMTAWFSLDTRIMLIESRQEAQEAKIGPRLDERFSRIEQLLVDMICTQQPQDPDRCRRATRLVGGRSE